MTSIYELIDSRSGLTRYVGKTTGALEDRLYAHLRGAVRSSSTSPIALWLHDCLVNDAPPSIHLIESVPDDEWRAAEDSWIRQRRAEGHPLTNAIAGGAGYDNRRASFTHLAELARAHDEGVIRMNMQGRQEKLFLAALMRGENGVVARTAAKTAWQSWHDGYLRSFGRTA